MTNSVDGLKKPFRLITIPVSHYCEKVRWALTRLKLPYVEERHTPPFHLWATGRVGGKLTPVLVGESETLTDSTDILKYLDEFAPINAKLYPINPELRQQVEQLEDLFNQQLGPATRCWAYSHVMDNYKFMQSSWCNGVPLVERTLFPVIFPPVRSIVRQNLNITPESAAPAYQQIQSVFTQVNELLADGRTYLVGDSFSAADLTFASLAAPAVSPPEHPITGASPELPSKMISEIKEFRATPAGAHVLSLYRTRQDSV